MNNEEFKPTSHDDVMGDRYEHPSYGVIEIGRWQSSGDMPLFGSSILHHNGIRIAIKTATLNRSLQRDWIHGDKTIVEFNMSPTQFADAITSMNSGSTPITLEYVIGDKEGHRKDPPYKSKVLQFNEEFESDIKDLGKRFDETIELAKQTNAQKRLVKEIEMLKMHFVSNIPFVNKSFTEQVEHTVKEAKGEVEAFVNTMVHNYGIEAIRKQAPQITEGTHKEIEAPKQSTEVKNTEANDENRNRH
jgi:hypothetical protein